MPTRTTSLVIVALGVVCCATCAVVLSLTGNGGFAGVAAAISGLALLVGLLLASMVDGLRETTRCAVRVARDVEDMQQRLLTIEQRIEVLRASAALSDRARGVLSRGQERMLLVQAAEEDIASRRFASANVLLRQLQLLGADDEAAQLGHRVRAAQLGAVLGGRGPTSGQTGGQASGQAGGQAGGQASALAQQPAFDGADADARFAPAAAAAAFGADVQASVPTSAPTSAPTASVGAAQWQLKAGLEQAFHAAAREGRTDDAMMVLAQLDSLITPEEAVPLREIARDVIAKTRDGMGEKFRVAIVEKRWKDAVGLGEQIARQFPNSRMASEVGGMMDALRARAAE
jgi:hypothetical protein